MKNVCLYLQIHQPLRLKKYRFFDIGNDTMYLDDYLNRSIINRSVENSYKPMNNLLKGWLENYGDQFKVSILISGLAIEQLRMFEPEVLQDLKAFAASGSIEFLSEPYSYSLSSIVSKDEFKLEVERHTKLIEKEFGLTPTTFVNTAMIYSDEIGACLADMGYKTMITEGAKHILGHKSPNYAYVNPLNPRLKLLLRDSNLSDDLRYRFSEREWCEWPLTAEKYVDWIDKTEGDVVNIFCDYETFGVYQNKDTGIFEFCQNFIDEVIKRDSLKLSLPSEITQDLAPNAVLHVPYAISWAGEAKDISTWLGNDLQKEALNKLYALKDRVNATNDEGLLYVWEFMKASNHFFYMNTKWFAEGNPGGLNPYDSPYDAFINFMNVLTDFDRQIQQKEEQNEVV